MNQLGPFAVLLAVAAICLAALGGLIAWHNEEGRRIRRGLRKVLGGELHADIVAHGRGRGAGFNFTRNSMAVTWDGGSWCLVYRIDELLGVELVADGQVVARSYRGEPRRPLDSIGGAEKLVCLRLLFDDPQHADFNLDLWRAEDADSRKAPSAADAMEDGARWLARTEAVFRRKPTPVATRPAPAAPRPRLELAPGPAAESPPPAPKPRPVNELHPELPFDDDDDPDGDPDEKAAL